MILPVAPPFKNKRIIADCIYAGSGGNGAIYVDAKRSTSWSAAISNSGSDWIQFQSASSGTGDAILKFSLSPNAGPDREATISISTSSGKFSGSHLIRQGSGEGIKVQSDEVMNLPSLEIPRIMELGIAGKFIATEIQKIPEPFDLIALVIVEIVVALGGLLTAALRASIPSELFPMPKPVFELPPIPPPSPLPDPATIQNLLAQVPLTLTFILEQTATLCVYIAIETLEES